MARKYYTDLDLLHTSKILNLPAPTDQNEVASKGYVDSLVNGLKWKQAVKVAADSNVDLSSPPETLDSITLEEDDRILLMGQTDSSENGIYLFTDVLNPLQRTADANTFEDLEQAVVTVEYGTYASSTFRQTETGGTLEQDSINFEAFVSESPEATTELAGIVKLATQAEVNAGENSTKAVTPETLSNYSHILKKYTEVVGDELETNFVITHNLNTEDVLVSVRETGGEKLEVMPEIKYTSANSLTLTFTLPPEENSIKVLVVG